MPIAAEALPILIQAFYRNLVQTDASLALAISQAVDSTANTPLTPEEFRRRFFQADPHVLADLQTIIDGSVPAPGWNPGPYRRFGGSFYEYWNGVPLQDAANRPEQLRAFVDADGHLMIPINLPRETIAYLRRTPDRATFLQTFRREISRGGTITENTYKDSLKEALRELFIRAGIFINFRETEGVMLTGNQREDRVALRTLYHLLGYDQTASALIIRDLKLEGWLNSPSNLEEPSIVIRRLQEQDPFFNPGLPSTRVIIPVTASVEVEALSHLMETRPSREQDRAKILIDQNISRIVIQALFEKLGIIIPPSLAARVVLNIRGYLISLQQLYKIIDANNKNENDLIKEARISIVPATEGLKKPAYPNNLPPKFRIFHAYFTLVNGPNYSLEEEGLKESLQHIPPLLTFKVPAIRIGATSRQAFWFQFGDAAHSANQWDDDELHQFISFVEKLRGIKHAKPPAKAHDKAQATTTVQVTTPTSTAAESTPLSQALNILETLGIPANSDWLASQPELVQQIIDEHSNSSLSPATLAALGQTTAIGSSTTPNPESQNSQTSALVTLPNAAVAAVTSFK